MNFVLSGYPVNTAWFNEVVATYLLPRKGIKKDLYTICSLNTKIIIVVSFWFRTGILVDPVFSLIYKMYQ